MDIITYLNGQGALCLYATDTVSTDHGLVSVVVHGRPGLLAVRVNGKRRHGYFPTVMAAFALVRRDLAAQVAA